MYQRTYFVIAPLWTVHNVMPPPRDYTEKHCGSTRRHSSFVHFLEQP